MQQVHINRLGVNSIEFETDSVEIPLSPGGEYSFEIVLINYGSPTNVHLSVSDPLKENITFLDDNPYVRHEEYVPVIVRIPPDGRLFNQGEMFVTVGYGSKKGGFRVVVGNPDTAKTPFNVDIDERLSRPLPVPPSNKKENHLADQLSDLTSHLLDLVSKSLATRSIVIIALLFLLLIALYAISDMIPTDFKMTSGFYPALAISILFTVTILYLLTKLSLLK